MSELRLLAYVVTIIISGALLWAAALYIASLVETYLDK